MKPAGRLGLAVLAAWAAAALLAGWLMPYPPDETMGAARQPPSAEFWLGTDMLGRDIASRILAGAQISLPLGVVSVALGAVPGIVLGMIAGYAGGWVDTAVSRLTDALLALPGVLLALVVIAALGPGLRNVMLAVAVSVVPQYVRLLRATVLAIQPLPYVEAARAVGNPAWRVLLRHIGPNVAAPVLVVTTLQIGTAVLTASGLSFLGLGPQPPTAEWGLMCAEGRDALRRAWWISTWPGLAILSLVVACNLAGDGLRAVLDPRGFTR